MTPTAVRRPSRDQGSLIWAAAGAAIAVHVVSIGLALVLSSGEDARRPAAALPPPPPDAEDVALETKCPGDVVLARAARTALCLAPWREPDLEGCLDEAEMMMWMDLSACMARSEPVAPIAMIPQAQLAKIPPIDPEQLVEELLQPEKPPPPPPPIPPPQPAQPPPPPPPPPPPQQMRKPQVVETVKPSDEKEPENARFLSEYNTRVEKQKVARGARSEPLVEKSKPEELVAKQEPKDDPSVQKQPEDKPPGTNDRAPDAPGKLSMRAPGAPAPQQEAPQEAKTRGAMGGAKGPIVADGFVPRSGDHAIEQQRRDPGEQTKGQGGAGGGAPRIPDLKPSKEVLERALGGGSVDHLEEVESGEENALNSKRWVYASFFNRLKRQVATHWDPQTVWRRSDPTGQHHGFKTRVTEVRVSLSPKGDLAKIVVTTPSGVTELDDEAVRSFRAAGPFPNPPDGLVKEGLITFAFSFHFEIGASRTSWRMPRQ